MSSEISPLLPTQAPRRDADQPPPAANGRERYGGLEGGGGGGGGGGAGLLLYGSLDAPLQSIDIEQCAACVHDAGET
jgi:hypothetical protein